MNNTYSIPELNLIEGWREQDIAGIDEKLCALSQLMRGRLSIEPALYKEKVIGSINECYVREAVMSLLLLAASKLPEGHRLVIWDAWRPWELENAMNPNKDLLSLDEPPLHSTGGAVAVSIRDEKGNLLDMGTGYNDKSKESYTRHFENLSKDEKTLSKSDQSILHNRRLLFKIMTSVGFINDPKEWYSFHFGNQAWSKVKKDIAFYNQTSPNA